MDINQSSALGNAEALAALFKQGGVGDPGDSRTPVTDVGDHVILVHGDLATCERVQSVQDSRRVEKTPFRRLQPVVFCMGLFHLKMACADAIWKVFIQPADAREDETSLMAYVAEIRPKETGKIASKPGFRRMHEVIRHIGIASRLDCWRAELAKRQVASLEDWAASKPSWDEVEAVATRLVNTYVADANHHKLRSAPAAVRDEQWENTLLREQYFLLYEELTQTMNAGDIGGVERCFMPWVWIFRGCGKHKYAAQMVRFLHNLYNVYPAALRHAIRMNIFCNPTGRKNQFRAIDWWVEHNNLYIKRIYGGQFSNRTKKRILKQAALLGVYKAIRISLEGMFALNHRTYRHSAPNLKKTLHKLQIYMEQEGAHVIKPGRRSKYSVPDVMEVGVNKLMSADGDFEGAADGVGVLEDEVNGQDGDLDV
ncbi:hypothetical protein OH76DRAFT_1351984 [Lentinus brumalis]|uniref:DUF6589 domain-containing protein n=1 Tax=Lentinus brumalis TaxID=2498619 RepID=A0A371D863_9APHY|nr:hypothetical protein OH76DRAFT_1351984 [Polyporus brumalis]